MADTFAFICGNEKSSSNGFVHIPVLLHQSVEFLGVRSGGIYADTTVGGGGHSLDILLKNGPDGRLIGFDRDPQALEAARRRLADFGDRALLVKANFSETGAHLENLAGRIDGILFDLGVSSPQIDKPGRGFSFMADGPLDMRMGDTALTASDVVNGYDQPRLAGIFKAYGEEREAGRIVRAIARQRADTPITTTGQLAGIIRSTRPAVPNKTLARIFQALRIEVNDELNSLRRALEMAPDLLAKRGRIVVISYHSLEDRIVKEFFKRKAGGCTCPPDLPVCACGGKPGSLRILTPKPVLPDLAEQRDNPRSRSAKLRAAEKT
ncbi:MAG: 16S rRNA (cytosine(1402)-N(4))-methyltransferase RsmH [Candidatus Edwardsbacteria bacterium]|nr:16S rRNA (cytosine(1402)-N(4))-methyltransferase RsmH [Candidatus Edwardsbacteria bacterium]